VGCSKTFGTFQFRNPETFGSQQPKRLSDDNVNWDGKRDLDLRMRRTRNVGFDDEKLESVTSVDQYFGGFGLDKEEFGGKPKLSSWIGD